jgi:hypothetical protein
VVKGMCTRVLDDVEYISAGSEAQKIRWNILFQPANTKFFYRVP